MTRFFSRRNSGTPLRWIEDRSYLIHEPAGPGPHPTILTLHGRGANAFVDQLHRRILKHRGRVIESREATSFFNAPSTDAAAPGGRDALGLEVDAGILHPVGVLDAAAG